MPNHRFEKVLQQTDENSKMMQYSTNDKDVNLKKEKLIHENEDKENYYEHDKFTKTGAVSKRTELDGQHSRLPCLQKEKTPRFTKIEDSALNELKKRRELERHMMHALELKCKMRLNENLPDDVFNTAYIETPQEENGNLNCKRWSYVLKKPESKNNMQTMSEGNLKTLLSAKRGSPKLKHRDKVSETVRTAISEIRNTENFPLHKQSYDANTGGIMSFKDKLRSLKSPEGEDGVKKMQSEYESLSFSYSSQSSNTDLSHVSISDDSSQSNGCASERHEYLIPKLTGMRHSKYFAPLVDIPKSSVYAHQLEGKILKKNYLPEPYLFDAAKQAVYKEKQPDAFSRFDHFGSRAETRATEKAPEIANIKLESPRLDLLNPSKATNSSSDEITDSSTSSHVNFNRSKCSKFNFDIFDNSDASENSISEASSKDTSESMEASDDDLMRKLRERIRNSFSKIDFRNQANTRSNGSPAPLASNVEYEYHDLSTIQEADSYLTNITQQNSKNETNQEVISESCAEMLTSLINIPQTDTLKLAQQISFPRGIMKSTNLPVQAIHKTHYTDVGDNNEAREFSSNNASQLESSPKIPIIVIHEAKASPAADLSLGVHPQALPRKFSPWSEKIKISSKEKSDYFSDSMMSFLQHEVSATMAANMSILSLDNNFGEINENHCSPQETVTAKKSTESSFKCRTNRLWNNLEVQKRKLEEEKKQQAVLNQLKVKDKNLTPRKK